MTSEQSKPSFEDLMAILQEQIKQSEELPMHVRGSFVTYLELENLMLLVYALFKAKRE
jgi:hypothetical protein